MEEYAKRAHRIAFAISKKTGQQICVRRMPLGKVCMAFEFTDGKRTAAFGQAFLDDNLAAFATRVMNALAEIKHGDTKGHARRKGEDV